MKTRAAVVFEAGSPYEIVEVDLAPPGPEEILVEIEGCGLCHTDVVAQEQSAPVPLPAVLGHEGSGTVIEVGPGVTDFEPGDKVALSFASCGHCSRCLDAEPFACDEMNDINFGGIMPDGTTRISIDGKPVSSFFGQSAFAEHAVVNVRSVVKVPEDVDLIIAGPLGCGIQTGAGAVLNRLKPVSGTTIGVFGAGTVGMSAIMAAKLTPAKQIIAIDINDNALALAKELGATHVINAKTTPDLVEEVKRISGGGLHYSIDTTGNSGSLFNAISSLRFSGICVVLGVTGELCFDAFGDLMAEAKTLTGCVEGDSNPRVFIPKLIEYYQDGRFPIDRLVKVYDFEEINQAFEDSGSGDVIKAVLRMKK